MTRALHRCLAVVRFALAGLAVLAAFTTGCGLNPQPMPPGETFGAGPPAVAGRADGGLGGSLSSDASEARYDASAPTVASTSADAGADARSASVDAADSDADGSSDADAEPRPGCVLDGSADAALADE